MSEWHRLAPEDARRALYLPFMQRVLGTVAPQPADLLNARPRYSVTRASTA